MPLDLSSPPSRLDGDDTLSAYASQVATPERGPLHKMHCGLSRARFSEPSPIVGRIIWMILRFASRHDGA